MGDLSGNARPWPQRPFKLAGERVALESNEQRDKILELPVVRFIESSQIVVPMKAVDDERGVVVLLKDEEREGPRYTTIPVLEGMNLDEPVVKPCRLRNGVCGRIAKASVQGDEAIHLRRYVVRRGVFEHGPIRTHDVVWVVLPVSVSQRTIKGSTQGVMSTIGSLGPCHCGVKLANEARGQRSTISSEIENQLQRVSLSLKSGEHLGAKLAALSLDDIPGKALSHEGLSEAPVDIVDPLKDSRFHSEAPKASLADLSSLAFGQRTQEPVPCTP